MSIPLMYPLMLIVACVALVIAVTIGGWVLRPLDQAARNRECPTQFGLADFFCLFFLFQLPAGLIHAWLAQTNIAEKWLLTGFAWGAGLAMWWFSVQTLSRAGIKNVVQRGIFLALVMPIAYFGAIAVPVAPPLVWVLVYQKTVIYTPGLAIGVGLFQIGLLFCLYRCGRYTRRIVNALRDAEPTVQADPLAPENQSRLAT